jgi:hypothetical protein
VWSAKGSNKWSSAFFDSRLLENRPGRTCTHQPPPLIEGKTPRRVPYPNARPLQPAVSSLPGMTEAREPEARPYCRNDRVQPHGTYGAASALSPSH